jgi:hypothetical protein
LYTNAEAAGSQLRPDRQGRNDQTGDIVPDVTTNITTLSKGVTDLARDAAYVAVGLGVLGFQRAQVQRVELQNKLSQDFSDFSLSQRLDDVFQGVTSGVSDVRQGVSKGLAQIDGLAESAAQFVESTFQPLEEKLPPAVSELTVRARQQAREVRIQIRQRVSA